MVENMFDKIENFVNERKFKFGVEHEKCDCVKIPIIAYMMTERKTRDKTIIENKPIYAEIFDENSMDYEIGKNEKLISIVPCTIPTFCVEGLVPCLKNKKEECAKFFEDSEINIDYDEDVQKLYWSVLGYEIQGQPHPDWEEELKNTWIAYLKHMYKISTEGQISTDILLESILEDSEK